jgi:F-box interacting protein
MRSKPLGYFSDSNPVYIGHKFTFGYDASTRTYKVVAVKRKKYFSRQTKVKVFNLSDCCWRYIKSFPVVPLKDDGEHLSGTVNWLAEDKSEELVIVLLDLSTETYKQFLLPPGFDDVLFVQPILRVLMDCLCFSHDYKKN